MRSEAGLTLTELMVALAVIAIAAGISVPYMLWALPGQRASGAARQVAGDLRLARTLAIERGKEIDVFFDEAAEQYVVYQDQDGTAGFDPVADEPGRVKTVTLPAQYKAIGIDHTTFNNGALVPDLVRFEPRGTIGTGGTVYLAADGHGDVRRRVVVTGASARVRIERWNPNTSSWE